MKPRIPETDQGIQNEVDVAAYDVMQRHFRDKGILETKELIKRGLSCGKGLEIGPGPGYLGLEWLRMTEETRLTAVDISAAMLEIARRNCTEYGFAARAEYLLGKGDKLPLEDNSFDYVFTTGSLHEWSAPVATFDEIDRVLKPGGKYFIGDLKRNTNFFIRMVMRKMVKPREIRPGFATSLQASYTRSELTKLLGKSRLSAAAITENPFGLSLYGTKPIGRSEN